MNDENYYIEAGASYTFDVRVGNGQMQRIRDGIGRTYIAGDKQGWNPDLHVYSKIVLVDERGDSGDDASVAAYHNNERIGTVPAQHSDFVRLFLDCDGRIEASVDEITPAAMLLSFRAVIHQIETMSEEERKQVTCIEHVLERKGCCELIRKEVPVALEDMAEKLMPGHVKPKTAEEQEYDFLGSLIAKSVR